jgi:hypothetical protein
VENLNVVDILKMGLPGLVLLLSVLSYRLLANEQGNEHPRDGVLKSIKQFMYLNLVFAVLTIAAPLAEGKFAPKSAEFTVPAMAGANLVKGSAAVCSGTDYANRYLLVRDVETGKLIQVFARSVIPCDKNPQIAINVQDAENLGWQTGMGQKDVRVVVALPGYMFTI